MLAGLAADIDTGYRDPGSRPGVKLVQFVARTVSGCGGSRAPGSRLGVKLSRGSDSKKVPVVAPGPLTPVWD